MYTMKNLIILIFVFFNCLPAYSQVTQLWAIQQDMSQDDQPESMAVDNSGNVYITGYKERFFMYMTSKYNSSGVLQWTRFYDGPGIGGVDHASSLALDNSGNVYVTGYSDGIGTQTDFVTIKYNTDGVQLWLKRFNGPSNLDDEAISIKVDALGNSYVLGSSFGNWQDFAVVKYDPAGNQLWVQRYSETISSTEVAYALAIDGLGNVYITGGSDTTSVTGSTVRSDFETIKYNTDGVLQWQKRYNSPSDSIDAPNSIAVDISGNVFVTGGSLELGKTNCVTIKYNSSGIQQWIVKNSGAEGKGAGGFFIRTDAAGNAYIAGVNKLTGTNYNCLILKYNSAGDQQFMQIYTPNSTPHCMELDAASNIYITVGVSTIKYNSSGIQQWIQSYMGPGNHPLGITCLAVEGNSNFDIAGLSNEYMYTLKYSQTLTGVHEPGNIPELFSLSQNYPNPFNPTTNIKYDLPVGDFVVLKVYDVIGNEIETLVNEKQNAGSYSVSFNAVNYPSGVYFYKLMTEKFSETKKMVVVK